MKKRFIELQLFAEDGGEGGDGGQQGNQQGDGQQSGKSGEGNNSKSELKYTDDDVDKLFNKKFAAWEKKKQKEIDEARSRMARRFMVKFTALALGTTWMP